MKAIKLVQSLFRLRLRLAQDIRTLTKDVALNSIEMGKKLQAAKETFPVAKKVGSYHTRPGWEQWVKKETGLSLPMVNLLIRVAGRFSETAVSAKIGNTVLRLLASPKVPDEAITEVTRRAEIKKVTEAEAKEIIHRATKGGITKKEIKKISAFHADNMPPLPKPRAAQKEARSTGEFVLASDGYYYSPASEADIEKNQKSLRLTCKVLRAVETLSGMEVTPHQFIEEAVFYMLWNTPKADATVYEAARWLNALATIWETSADSIRQRVVEMRERHQKVRVAK